MRWRFLADVLPPIALMLCVVSCSRMVLFGQ
jgi:hypothetical protein